MALSKRQRFEIFKRDSFTCQYCGCRPPDVVLEVDHIHPRAEGGEDEELNLITACWNCNRGKGARVLADKAIRPDADIKYLELQQELAEATRFLKAKDEIDSVRQKIVEKIQDHWAHILSTGDSVPADAVILQWLSFYTPEEIVRAIDRAAPAINGRPWTFRGFHNYVKYVSGVLRNESERARFRL